MANKQKKDKTQLLTTAVVTCLIVFFLGGIGIGLNNVLAMEGQYPPTVNEEGKTPAPETAEQALAFLNTSLQKATAEKPMTETKSAFDIDTDTLETTGSEQFKQSLLYIKDNVDEALEESVNCPTTAFGGDLSKILRLPDVTAADITDFACNYTTYHCPTCGEDVEAYAEKCDLCGSDRPSEIRYKENYEITLHLAVKDVPNRCFAPKTAEEYVAICKPEFENKVALQNTTVTYTGLTVYYEVNRLTDEIVCLRYTKEAAVGTDVAFCGDFAAFTGGSIGVNMKEEFTYSFTWPHLTLNNETMTVAPKGNDNLLATLICDDPTAYTVKWASSDPNLVLVDEEGYFKAGKETGTAIITASFAFQGKTYSDSCEIKVLNAVESLKMSPKKVKLAEGDSKELQVTFSPKKATDQALQWYTEDETIATVDAQGKVTAVGKGKTTVYCLSHDGYFKSSCEVTVK